MKITPQQAIERIKVLGGPGLSGQKKAKAQSAPQLVGTWGDNVYVVTQGKQGMLLPADDTLRPVIGIFDAADVEDMPPALHAWLGEYHREIEFFQYNEGAAKPEMAKVKASAAEIRLSVQPMIRTSWTQKAPYNDHLTINGEKCLTGCNATAMAQLLYYWWQKGYHRGCTATPEYKSGKTVIEALPPIPWFDYDNLTLKKPTTALQKEAVATLMEYMGKAIRSVYGTSVTTANIAVVATVLKNSVRMGSKITTIYAAAGEDAFEQKIYKQMTMQQPVIMAGWSSSGGHTFICDGYDAEKDLYHFNWGWGSYDGWFAMSALNPYKYTFNSSKKAVIGIHPEYALCDVNGDGKVTDEDAMEVVQDILNDKYREQGDVNYDGKETVTDAMLIIDKANKEK